MKGDGKSAKTKLYSAVVVNYYVSPSLSISFFHVSMTLFGSKMI